MNRFYPFAVAAIAAIWPMKSAFGQIAVISDPVLDRDAVPGETYQVRLLLKNTSAEPQEARIYQTDYSFTADGRSVYGKPGDMARSNAKWITVSPSYVSIAPDATVPVVYTVAVPKDSTLVGTYWSMVMIEAIVPGSIESRRPPKNARVDFGLSVSTRYGTQVATNIGATGLSKVAFDSLTATTNADGARGLRFDFINTGERANRFVMSLELYDDSGELIKKASQHRGLLYPGSAARQMFDVGSIPSGSYTAVLVADGGGDRVFGGQFKVAF
jgi:hypothetical protein